MKDLFLCNHPQLTSCRPDRHCLLSSARRPEHSSVEFWSSLSFGPNDDGPEASICPAVLGDVHPY